jgi:hypothetical protein
MCESMCGMCAGLTASEPEVAVLGSTLGVPCILCDGLCLLCVKIYYYWTTLVVLEVR